MLSLNNPFLRERMKQHEIPDMALLRMSCTFDRVIVAQIPMDDSDDTHYRTRDGAESVILKSDWSKKVDTKTAPRGVLLWAGPEAYDILHSNGYDIGHRVWFVKNTPWALPVCYRTETKHEVNATAAALGRHEITEKQVTVPFYIIPMLVEDLVGSEDLSADLQAGRKEYIYDTELQCTCLRDNESQQVFVPKKVNKDTYR